MVLRKTPRPTGFYSDGRFVPAILLPSVTGSGRQLPLNILAQHSHGGLNGKFAARGRGTISTPGNKSQKLALENQ